MAGASEDATRVRWDLEPIVDSRGDAGVDALLDEATVAATSFAAAYAGDVASLDAATFARAVDELAAIRNLVARAKQYAELRLSVDTESPLASALAATAESRAAQIDAQVLFLELEWTALDDDAASRLLADAHDRIAQAAHHLQRLRLARSHQLSEREERVLARTRGTRLTAWKQLYTERTSALTATIDGEALPIMAAWSRLQSPDRSVRQAAMAALAPALEDGLATRVAIYNAVLDEKAVDDRLRGYETWVASRNLENELPDAAVDALVTTVGGRNELFHRWLAVKRRVLGLDTMSSADVPATLADASALAGDHTAGGEAGRVAWGEMVALVVGAYTRLHPRAGEVAASFFTGRRVDAPVVPGKVGGAFSTDPTAASDPYLLLNFTGAPSDPLMLAHELGHGIHFALSRGNGPFGQATSIPFIEFPSNFGETLVLDEQLADAERTDADRLVALGTWLDSAMGNVFGAMAGFRLEETIHTGYRSNGPLDASTVTEASRREYGAAFGPEVTVEDGDSLLWSWIPHMIGEPGYLYSYAFGCLLSLTTSARAREVGPAFAEDYLAMLAAGGTRSPTELVAMIGLDLTDPAFWDAGLDLLEERVAEAERLAAALT